MLLACSTACFLDLSLQDALDCVAACGFDNVDICVSDDGHVLPASVRDDYETEHLLIGFGCAQARLKPGSLSVRLPPQSDEDELQLLRSACTLAHSLGLPGITIHPSEQRCAEAGCKQRFSRWTAVASERETDLRIFLRRRERSFEPLLTNCAESGIALSTDVRELSGGPADIVQHLGEVLVTAADPGIGEQADRLARLVELAAQHPTLRIVAACPPVGDRDTRIRQISALRSALAEHLAGSRTE